MLFQFISVDKNTTPEAIFYAVKCIIGNGGIVSLWHGEGELATTIGQQMMVQEGHAKSIFEFDLEHEDSLFDDRSSDNLLNISTKGEMNVDKACEFLQEFIDHHPCSAHTQVIIGTEDCIKQLMYRLFMDGTTTFDERVEYSFDTSRGKHFNPIRMRAVMMDGTGSIYQPPMIRKFKIYDVKKIHRCLRIEDI